MLSVIPKQLYVFLCSMLPLVELRGGIILGSGLGIPWIENLMICVVGNMLPIPFILLFIRSILKWMKTTKHLSKIALFIEDKAQKHSHKVQRYALFGLFLFVAIPLPGTGAWTGALIAALLDMRLKYSVPSIFFGVLVAGIIMCCACYGFIGFLNFLI